MRGDSWYGLIFTRSHPASAPLASRIAARYVPRTSRLVWAFRVSTGGPPPSAVRWNVSVRSEAPSGGRTARRIALSSQLGSIVAVTGAVRERLARTCTVAGAVSHRPATVCPSRVRTNVGAPPERNQPGASTTPRLPSGSRSTTIRSCSTCAAKSTTGSIGTVGGDTRRHAAQARRTRSVWRRMDGFTAMPAPPGGDAGMHRSLQIGAVCDAELEVGPTVELRLGAHEAADVEVRVGGGEARGIPRGPQGIAIGDQAARPHVRVVALVAVLPARLFRRRRGRETRRLARHASRGAARAGAAGEALGKGGLEVGGADRRCGPAAPELLPRLTDTGGGGGAELVRLQRRRRGGRRSRRGLLDRGAGGLCGGGS